METLAGLRTVVYARFSSEQQRETSIDDQVSLCRAALTQHAGGVRDEMVLTDYAVSGTVLARTGFDRLLALVSAREVDLVITESGDRLTRDLGDADRLWKLCEFHAVRLICVSDGIDSALDGSRMAFRFRAMMSDEYVRDLAKKTLRGLRGQFDRDRSTGGRTYGYTTVPVMNGGRDPDGYDIEIDPVRATVVVRIFEMYVAGRSYLEIATQLNREGIEPPGAKSRRKAPKMWRKETVRSILGNRKYVGGFTFCVKQWRKDPVTRRRRYAVRTEGVQTDLRPHLAIVSETLFTAAQGRKQAVSTRKNSGRKTAHPFSGLLFCHACGSRMVFVGGSTKAYYICNGAHSTGMYANKALVREDFLIDHAIAELKNILSSEELWRDIRADIEAELCALHSRSESEREQLQKDVLRYESEIARFIRFIASTDDGSTYDAIRRSLDGATAKKKEAEARLKCLKAAPSEPPALPTVAEARALAMHLQEHITEDPTGFREFMRSAVLADGRIVMEPLPGGGYRAHSQILPMNLAGTRNAKTLETVGASRVSGPSLVGVGCGGRI